MTEDKLRAALEPFARAFHEDQMPVTARPVYERAAAALAASAVPTTWDADGATVTAAPGVNVDTLVAAPVDHITWAQQVRADHEATHGEAEQCGAECIVLGLTEFADSAPDEGRERLIQAALRFYGDQMPAYAAAAGLTKDEYAAVMVDVRRVRALLGDVG